MRDNATLSTTPVEVRGTLAQKEKAKQLIEDLTIQNGNMQAWADKCNRNFAASQLATAPVAINWGELKQQAEEYESKKWSDCPDIVKNFYVENNHVALMSEEEVKKIRLVKKKIINM